MAQAIYEKIRDAWKSHGWDWESRNGEVAKRMAELIPEVFAEEFQEVRSALRTIAENLDNISFKTDRAHDAFMLYKKLEKEGADRATISYAVHAYLSGNVISEIAPKNDEVE